MVLNMKSVMIAVMLTGVCGTVFAEKGGDSIYYWGSYNTVVTIPPQSILHVYAVPWAQGGSTAYFSVSYGACPKSDSNCLKPVVAHVPGSGAYPGVQFSEVTPINYTDHYTCPVSGGQCLFQVRS